MTIINFTQHSATPEQRKAGVWEYNTKRDCFLKWIRETGKDERDYIRKLPESLNNLLTFRKIPTEEILRKRAVKIVSIAETMRLREVMIGEDAYFTPYLHDALLWAGIKPLYSFQREGKHIGFVGE